MSKKKDKYDEREVLNSSIFSLEIARSYNDMARNSVIKIKGDDLLRHEEEDELKSLFILHNSCKRNIDNSIKAIKRVHKEKRRASLLARVKKTIQIWKI